VSEPRVACLTPQERATGAAAHGPTLAGLEPGSNRRDVLAQADWRFLLGDTSAMDVLVIGVPSRAVVAAIAACARTVVVATADPQVAHGLLRDLESDASNVTISPVARDGTIPAGGAEFDAVICCSGVSAAPRRSSGLVREIARVTRPAAAVYVEGGRIGVARFERQWTQYVDAPGSSAHRFWLIRRRRSTRAAIPTADAAALGEHFVRHVLHGNSRAWRLLAPVAAFLARHRLLHRVSPHHAVRVTRAPQDAVGTRRRHAFEDLVDIGLKHQIDLSGHRSALLARGAYDSNKVAVYFFEPNSGRPDVIVKATRTPRFNHRLDAEFQALQRLHSVDAVRRGSYPEALFLDTFQDLTVLGQKVVHGAPFRARTSGKPDCPLARDGIAWITQLGAATAVHDAFSGRAVAEDCESLTARAAELYGLSTSEVDFLTRFFDRFRQAGTVLPLVFRHGDAGIWNVLATADDRCAFLDWEASEPAGPPLWDLFDFVRSFGNWIGRVQGERDSTAIYARAFAARGPLADLQATAVRQYSAAVGVHPDFVAPLFYSCWLQRAIREAAWATGHLVDGTFIRLLRLCIEKVDEPGMRWLHG
jgi:SAM-dependent methyltransferase